MSCERAGADPGSRERLLRTRGKVAAPEPPSLAARKAREKTGILKEAASPPESGVGAGGGTRLNWPCDPYRSGATLRARPPHRAHIPHTYHAACAPRDPRGREPTRRARAWSPRTDRRTDAAPERADWPSGGCLPASSFRRSPRPSGARGALARTANRGQWRPLSPAEPPSTTEPGHTYLGAPGIPKL